MIDPLSTALIGGSLLVAAVCLGLIVANRLLNLGVLVAVGVLEVGLIAQLIVGFLQLAGTQRDVATGTFVGYLVGAVLVLPVGTLWSLTERSRWGVAVLAVTCLVIAVLVVRLQQVWAAGG